MIGQYHPLRSIVILQYRMIFRIYFSEDNNSTPFLLIIVQ